MPTKKKPCRATLCTDVELIKQRLDEIEGPIKETLERVRTALVGTEDGAQQGLLSRVLLAENGLHAAQQAVNEIRDQLKEGDTRMDELERTAATTTKDVGSLEDDRSEAKKSFKHWKKLIIGGILTGAISLGWYWVQKVWIDDKVKTVRGAKP